MQPALAPVQLSTRSSLSALEAVFGLFRELRPEMPIQLPLVFVLIAQHKGISAARLCKLTGLSQSAMSRNITVLTREGKKDEPGLGLVVKSIDPANPRAHAIHLTKDGRVVAARLAEVLAKSVKLRRGEPRERSGSLCTRTLLHGCSEHYLTSCGSNPLLRPSP